MGSVSATRSGSPGSLLGSTGPGARYANIDPKDWIRESVALRGQVYPDVIGSATTIFFSTRMRCARASWLLAGASRHLNAACEAVPAACAP